MQLNKKHLAIVGALIVVSFIGGFFVGDSSAINRINGSISQNVESSTTAEVTTTEEAHVKEEAKKEAKKELIITKVGVEATSGSWSIKVLDAQEATTVQGGNSSDNKTTKQKFIILKLQMKNITQSPMQYAPTEFMLGDIKSNSQYAINLDALQAANSNEIIYKENSEFIGVYDDVNPNMPKQTYVIFEVPKDMVITDGVMTNVNSGADTVGYYIK